MGTWVWPASTIPNVVDGDTIDALVTRDIGFEGKVTYPVRLRLNRINAPKVKTERGAKAKARVLALVTGVPVTITTSKHYKYGGPDSSTGEWMAEVVLADGRNISDTLVLERLADFWDGDGPRPDDDA